MYDLEGETEMMLEYRLEAADTSTPLLTNSEKSKANSDDEDLLTPMVEQLQFRVHASACVAITASFPEPNGIRVPVLSHAKA
jgi:hypothetical protein